MPPQEREEELLVVQAIYCDPFNTFEAVDDTHFRFHSVPIVLSITLPLTYPDPLQQPEISIDSEGLGVSQLQMFQLRMRLEAILQSKPDEPVLFELTEETREFTEGLRDDVKVCLEEEEEDVVEDDWLNHHTDDFDRRVVDHSIAHSHMGSLTIQTIVSTLPKSTRLLHAEIVLRIDLRRRYLDMQRKIQQDATRGINDRRAKDTAWDRYGQETIVFHGTLRRNVGSIVRSGFIVPGEKTATGEHVQGIYTSPDPDYSLSYTDWTPEGGVKGRRRLLPGQKLIVCAVLMGRRHLMSSTRRLKPTVEQGFDSHVSPNEMEYVVFNSAQVLPLYVLHLGDGPSASASSSMPMALDVPRPGLVHFEGNLTEYARKHLPHGFGAASGHRFVVEAIAPVDDDEELWGDYQHDDADERGEFQGERESGRYW
ncbi:hypothetical protein D9615_002665 [Tricholomella constricta]|uniref:RWD domain-containing protein n=1 Tax=Tricholomella constricta TaxID=117010 RepID=A0A8H5HMX0_9AGAR|nr:hypothetical protein D9615_002665 [Tricholomella constricta]